MSILSRYILRSHIGPFIFGVVTVVFLFLFQFLMRYLGDLVGKGLSYWVILQLIGLNIPWMLVLAIPMGVLFSTLMTFGNMSAFHEVTIVKTSGGGLIKMMAPVLVAGLVITIFLFWFNDRVLPEANHRAKVLLNDITRKKPTFSIEPGQFSTQLEGYTILARSLDSATGLLKGVTVYDNSRGNRIYIISGDTGNIEFSKDYSKLIMHLYSGEIHQLYSNSAKDYNRIFYKTYELISNASGFNFERSNEKMVSRGDREMSIKDMEKIIHDAENNRNAAAKRIYTQLNRNFAFMEGKETSADQFTVPFNLASNEDIAALKKLQQRTTFLKTTISSDIIQETEYSLKAGEYKVEVQKKYAIPFACIIFILVGCPLGIMTKGGNFGLSAAISLGFYIFYWACLIGGEKLADRGYVNPVIAMWTGNLIIGIVGTVLTLKINNESITFPGKSLVLKLAGKMQTMI